MFEDDPKAALDGMYGYYYPVMTEVIINKDDGLDNSYIQKEYNGSHRKRLGMEYPKLLVLNTLEASKPK